MMRDLRRNGYHWVPRIENTEMLAIGALLGNPRADTRDEQVVKVIRPQAQETAGPNTLSSRHGFNAFPFHTDVAYWRCPARFLILRCLDVGEGNRPTMLIDAHSWLSDYFFEELLRDAICTVAGCRPFLAPIAAQTGASAKAIRYDGACMRPANARAAGPFELLGDLVAKAPITEIRWRPKSMLIIDNHRMFHSRGVTNIPDPSRAHQRMLVEEQ